VGLLDGIKRLLGRADEAVTEAELGVLDVVHRAEDAVDDATGGRFYDAVEKIDEEADELGEKLHLDDPRLDGPPAPSL
jgi:hypothetical protein